MSARAAIENTINKYAYLFDEDMAERIGECFSVQGQFVLGAGALTGREAISADMVEKRNAPHYRDGTRPVHVNTNTVVIEETNSEAKSFTYWTLYRISPDGEPKLSMMGVYRDDFVKEGDQWLIKQRRAEAISKFLG